MPEPTHPYPDDLQRAFALLARLESAPQKSSPGDWFSSDEWKLLLTLVREGTEAIGRRWLGMEP
jgi:hypothetical protein